MHTHRADMQPKFSSTFGLLFPPLAAIICVAIFNVTFVNQLMIMLVLQRVNVEAPQALYAYILRLGKDLHLQEIHSVFRQDTVLLLGRAYLFKLTFFLLVILN